MLNLDALNHFLAKRFCLPPFLTWRRSAIFRNNTIPYSFPPYFRICLSRQTVLSSLVFWRYRDCHNAVRRSAFFKTICYSFVANAHSIVPVRRTSERIDAISCFCHRVCYGNELLRFAARVPLTNRLQRLFISGAPFAITIKLRLILANDLIAVVERLDMLRDSRCRIRRALHHLPEVGFDTFDIEGGVVYYPLHFLFHGRFFFLLGA